MNKYEQLEAQTVSMCIARFTKYGMRVAIEDGEGVGGRSYIEYEYEVQDIGFAEEAGIAAGEMLCYMIVHKMARGTVSRIVAEVKVRPDLDYRKFMKLRVEFSELV